MKKDQLIALIEKRRKRKADENNNGCYKDDWIYDEIIDDLKHLSEQKPREIFM